MRYIGSCLANWPSRLCIHRTDRRRGGTGISALRRIKQMVWSHPAVKHSYFKNSDGEIHTVSPWRLNEYWAATREPDWSNFE